MTDADRRGSAATDSAERAAETEDVEPAEAARDELTRTEEDQATVEEGPETAPETAEDGDETTTAGPEDGEDGDETTAAGPEDGDETAVAPTKKKAVKKARTVRKKAEPASSPRAGVQVLVVLGLVTAALAAAVVWLFLQQRELAATEKSVRQASYAASRAAEDLSSYDYRTIDSDLRRATGHTTGSFRRQFEALVPRTKASAVQQQAQVKGTAIRAAVEDAAPGRMVALVFLNQQTVKAASTKTDQMLPDQHTLRLTMIKVGDRWLVSKLEVL
ncbi:hypothetical protein DPM19_10585 [Actinomadura craniellae]|uniref:Mce-associated membrane protein n=1 Tax=Actinomadura craniellae TaxID=2231787 RepID=A0A365H7T2_9ACTN|nr:hypothetical protein [Actinomadura craniellae]RAY15165.1 hypothetical protein DPM19_10585 [Actinomadura craniellae]